MKPEAKALPTKDLFESYVKERVASRWAAFYLVATSALILAWSRSPGWSFKFPFEIFKNGKDDLTISAGFAPVFGPLIESFFYYNFFKINNECLGLARVVLGRFKHSMWKSDCCSRPLKSMADASSIPLAHGC